MTTTEAFTLTERPLSLEQVFQIAHYHQPHSFQVAASLWQKVQLNHDYLTQLLKDPHRIIYGINTGFGALSQKIIPAHQLKTLQVNLIRSHCTGVGELFPIPVVRAAILLRAYCLLQGHSGVRREVIEIMLKFLELQITPCVPSQGSVGASGDLAPLAHCALAFIGEGSVYYQGQIHQTKDVLQKLAIKPLVLEAKEGLALINGTSVLTSLGILATVNAQNLIYTADIIAAASVDALQGSIAPFHPLLQLVKPHSGQIAVASNMLLLLTDSQILQNHAQCDRVQDPYSLRCIPQVHGAIRQTLRHAQEVLTTEANAITDNPLLFPDQDLVLSGGNFHGEAAALVMDYLAMGLTELANISERRIEKMMNPQFSRLPAFLTKDSGINSGYMIAQVTAAALASENKYLSHPASIDNIPTSTDKEDHVSMGVTAGRKLQQVVQNSARVLAIELLCAVQAIDFQRPLRSSAPLEIIHSYVRNLVPTLTEDRVLSEQIELITQHILDGSIRNALLSYKGLL